MQLLELAEDLKYHAHFSGQSTHDALCDLVEQAHAYSMLTDEQREELITLAEK